MAFVGVAALAGGAFDLDAEEASVVVDGEVVGSGVSPGFGDAESLLGGAGHEAHFGPLSALFGVRSWRFAFLHVLETVRPSAAKSRVHFCGSDGAAGSRAPSRRCGVESCDRTMRLETVRNLRL